MTMTMTCALPDVAAKDLGPVAPQTNYVADPELPGDLVSDPESPGDHVRDPEQ